MLAQKITGKISNNFVILKTLLMEEKGEQIINRKHGWLRPVSRTAYSC
jgi:hypothetical protein